MDEELLETFELGFFGVMFGKIDGHGEAGIDGAVGCPIRKVKTDALALEAEKTELFGVKVVVSKVTPGSL